MRHPQKDAVFGRYLRCLIDGNPSSTGVPDGDPSPAVVRNLRNRVTLRPDASGNLGFNVLVSPLGTVHQVAGSSVYAGVGYHLDSTTANGMVNLATAFANAMHSFPLTLTPMQCTDRAAVSTLRLVNAVHTIHFTGSSLANGGDVTVDVVDLVSLTPASIGSTAGARDALYNGSPNNMLSAGLTPQALVGPARNSVTLAHLPVDREYHTPSLMYCTTAGAMGCANQAGYTLLTPRVYRVAYRGLDPSASVTIDSRICVQEQIRASDTSFYAFAKPSELCSPTILQTFLGQAGSQRLYDWGFDKLRTAFIHAARYAVTATTGIPMSLTDI